MKTNNGITAAMVIGPLLVTLLAFASTAAAEVVYTPANVTLSGNGSIKIDLNHDAVTDFVLQSSFKSAYCGTVGGGYTGTTQISPTIGDGIVVSHLNFAALLARGTAVGASSIFYNARSRVAQLKACGSTSKFAAGYLGLEFQINGQTHYGWAQVAISVHAGFRPGMSTTLIDFAYETIPGRGITTGQISGNLTATESPSSWTNPIEFSTSSQLIAQRGSPQLDYDQRRRIRYRLVDLGTLGGPSSSEFASPVINNQGAITGASDTSDSDPNAPNCYNPDCFVNHAYIWTRGTFTDLGGLPGGFGSEGNGINDHNQVAGQSLNGLIDPLVGTPAGIAVLWQSDGQIVDLGTLGGNQSLAATLNNQGQVVGGAANAIPDEFSMFGWATQTRAFLWQKGTMRDLGTLGGPDAFAIFINKRSQVAGVAYTNSTANPGTGIPTQDPFLWENGRMKDLGSLGGTLSFVNAFNNRGQVAGESNLVGDSTSHPFLWDGMALKDLGSLGGSFGFATALNDLGEVSGGAWTAHDEALHAFLWTNGVMEDLGTINDDTCSVVHGMNSQGLVVGTSGDCPDGVFEQHGFLSLHGGSLINLNDFVPPQSELVITDGESINDRGEIAGSGMLPSGDFHAVVLLPCNDTEEDCMSASDYNAGLKPTIPRVLSQEARRRKLDAHEMLATFHSPWARRYSGLSHHAGAWKLARP